MTRIQVPIGLQLTGNSQVGTLVQGIDPVTAKAITDNLVVVSERLLLLAKVGDTHGDLAEDNPIIRDTISKAQHIYDEGRVRRITLLPRRA